MDSSTVNAFITGCIGLLVGGFGFMATRWVKHVDGLQQSMDNLREAVLTLPEKFVTQVQHQKDLEALRILTQFGHRKTDMCPQSDCPIIGSMETRG